MRRRRRTITVLALLTLAFATLSIATADANSLLSGYGGPGEGNQAILGSALINGPSGKGGSGGGRSGGSTGAPADSGSLVASSNAGVESVEAPHTGHRSGSTAGASGAGKGSGSSAAGKEAETVAGKASGEESQTYTHPSELKRANGGSQALGLSGADLGYILLALGILAFTGIFTLRLVRQPVSG
jgi:hypothetical protein